jgi:Protein-disulfide isomerase
MAVSFKTISAALALTVALAVPPAAMALDDKQKEEIGAFIKEFLIANPEIMLDVQDALEQKQEEARLQQAQAAIENNQEALFSSANDVAFGNPKGDVTIVEFFDYNCGYCKRAMADMDKILASDSNVRFVLKELPILGEASVEAHKVSDAFRKIAPEKYLDFHRALLGSSGRADDAKAVAVAESLGVSEAQIRQTMKDNPSEDSVREAYQLATSLGVTGTPSYVVGKEAMFGAVGAATLEQKVSNVRTCGKTVC